MTTSPDAVEWFSHQLSTSDSAAVKEQYLRWHAEDDGVVFHHADPLSVAAIEESSTFAWTVAEILWRARLISLDERTLWAILGPNMVAQRVRRAIDPWNEQLAVKVAYYFLQSQSPASSSPLSVEERKSAIAEEWSRLRAELDHYAAATIKPKGTSTVSDYLPIVTSAQGATNPTVTDAVTEEWSDKVAFLPMEANNDLSEGALRCVAPVPSLGVLLQVPRTEMFFRDTILQHCALGRAIATAPALRELLSNEEAVLVVCLTFERFVVGGKNSHWQRLLAQCPSSYPTIPTTWALGDVAELAGLDMLDDVLAKRTQLQAVADQVATSLVPIFHELLQSEAERKGTASPIAVPSEEELRKAFVWANLAWAQSTFDSRAFNLNVDGAVVMALVPLADMINHTNRTDVLIRKVEPDGGPFTMQVGAALTSADVGRELWMSYGPLQNWELLQHYGFVLGCENVHDTLPFPLALPDLDAAAANDSEWDVRRRDLLRRYALCLPNRCWIGYDGVPPPALLATLRVQLAEADEFDAMEAHRYGPFAPLSATTEAAVVSAVKATVECVLDVFPTTLSEDEETLAELRAPAHDDDVKSDDVDESSESEPESMCNFTLCVQLRIGLKRIASRTLEWCRQQQ